MNKFLVVCTVFLAVGVKAADQPGKTTAPAAGKTSAAPTSPALPGQAIYVRMHCATCHAVDLKGNPPMTKMLGVSAQVLSLAQTALEKSDEQLKTAIAKGQGKMPAYETQLKPTEIDSLVAYIRSQTTGTK